MQTLHHTNTRLFCLVAFFVFNHDYLTTRILDSGNMKNEQPQHVVVMNKVIDEFMRLAPWLRQSEKLL
jgi:hypothetical protein